MNIEKKEKLFKYLAKHFDSMYYPPIMIWRKIKRELIKEGWRRRTEEISEGTIDYPSLYIHIPYCQTKCFFCKFITRVGNFQGVLARYLKCLKEEIEEFSPIFKKIPFKTLYLAGGTPTIFSASQLDTLFNILEKRFNLKETFQRLIESTPATLSEEKLKILKKHGINRLTIGIQVLNKELLSLINRKNQTEEMVKESFFRARELGIEIINLDLVAGLPGQTNEIFLKDLDFVLGLRPDALHIYPYEEEESVIFYKMGKRLKANDRIKRDEMFRLADTEIRKHGYQPYRNEPYLLSWQASNFYFQFRDLYNSSILGLGAMAESYIPYRYVYQNSGLDEYLNFRLKKYFSLYLNGYPLNKNETLINYIINNIRAGLDKKKFFKLFNLDFDKAFYRELESLRKLKRLEEDKEGIKLVAKNDFEFRTYSKFFFSPRIIKELREDVKDVQ